MKQVPVVSPDKEGRSWTIRKKALGCILQHEKLEELCRAWKRAQRQVKAERSPERQQGGKGARTTGPRAIEERAQEHVIPELGPKTWHKLTGQLFVGLSVTLKEGDWLES